MLAYEPPQYFSAAGGFISDEDEGASTLFFQRAKLRYDFAYSVHDIVRLRMQLFAGTLDNNHSIIWLLQSVTEFYINHRKGHDYVLPKCNLAEYWSFYIPKFP